MSSTTVVIPTYNDAEFLRRAVASVLAGTWRPVQIVVSDDGSSDTLAAEVCEQLRGECNDKGVRLDYIRDKNAGPSSARNRGIQKAVGDYITFLDCDDEWLPHHLESKQRELDSLPRSYFGCFGPFLEAESHVVAEFMRSYDGHLEASLVGKPGGLPGSVSSYLLRTAAVVEVGGFDSSLWLNEDFDLLVRIGRTGRLARGIDSPCFLRHRRDGSLTRGVDALREFERSRAFLLKAWRHEYFESKELIRRAAVTWVRVARSCFRRSVVRTSTFARLKALAEATLLVVRVMHPPRAREVQ